MADIEVTNWFGDIASHPKVVVEPASVEDIIAVLKNPDKLLNDYFQNLLAD